MTGGRCVLVLAALLGLAGCGESETGLEVGAYRACERAVETQLRAPSTADYSGFSGSEVTSSGDDFHVSGHVDSENGFGAQVRSSFTCVLEHAGDNWELVSINVV